MCGIIGIVGRSEVAASLYDALTVLQHRGQDAAGIATVDGKRLRLYKGNGLVRDVFDDPHIQSLAGRMGIGHCRYPTAGCESSEEAQPFYVNSPFGLLLAHNGNLTNSEALKREMFLSDLRHINTSSDSEVLLNVFAHELQAACKGLKIDEEAIFTAVAGVHRRCRGAYAVVVMIAGYGLLAFRDPYGIRPLVIGRNDCEAGTEWLVASESVAVDVLGFRLLRDVAPGEAVLVDTAGRFHSRQCAARTVHAPCMFEFVYLARPDSIIDGVSVYESRMKMGEFLADKMRRTMPNVHIDVVIPIPDSSRPSAMQMADRLDLPFREGFVKNRYIGRTFIMPGQATRRKSVRQKLNTIHQEFKGKSVLLVDDSIVRGTTSKEIVNMAREAGATKVYLASAAPPVRYANVYGIDMPTRGELIASDRSEEEICREIGANGLIYQDLDDLKASVRALNPSLQFFETSCFDGHYITGDITVEYLNGVENQRSEAKPGKNDQDDGDDGQLDLNLASDAEH